MSFIGSGYYNTKGRFRIKKMKPTHRYHLKNHGQESLKSTNKPWYTALVQGRFFALKTSPRRPSWANEKRDRNPSRVPWSSRGRWAAFPRHLHPKVFGTSPSTDETKSTRRTGRPPGPVGAPPYALHKGGHEPVPKPKGPWSQSPRFTHPAFSLSNPLQELALTQNITPRRIPLFFRKISIWSSHTPS